MAGGNNNIARSHSAEIFEQYRPVLYSLAYDILGIDADAQRMVEEVFARWLSSPDQAMENARTFLVVSIASLCMRQLERTQRLEGAQASTCPFTSGTGQCAPQGLPVTHSISAACLLLLNQLTPVERIAFLLRTAFRWNYAQIARTLDQDEAQCRRMVKRIKRYMAFNRSVLTPSSPPDLSQI